MSRGDFGGGTLFHAHKLPRGLKHRGSLAESHGQEPCGLKHRGSSSGVYPSPVCVTDTETSINTGYDGESIPVFSARRLCHAPKNRHRAGPAGMKPL